jgi:CBS domain-containing protein
MNAGDVMTQSTVTVDPEAPIEHAIQLMLKRRISGLPVVDNNGALVGVVTEGDLLRRAEHRSAGRAGSSF